MRRSDRAHTARITCACHLDWQVAERCDHDVVKAIAQRQELDAVYTLNYTSLFSEFFEYLRLIGLWEPLEALMPEHKERWMIPVLPLVLVYLQQHIMGPPSINAVEEVLLTNQKKRARPRAQRRGGGAMERNTLPCGQGDGLSDQPAGA